MNASISLNGTVDSYEGDNFRNLTLTVGPPPLPVLHTVISYDNQGLESGASVDINLNVSNNGSIGFSGNVLCEFDEMVVFNATVDIGSLMSYSDQFALTVRPGNLFCSVSGQRFDPSSISSVMEVFSVESALFEYAGGSSPTSTDGPWHIGDESTFSLLVRNTGTKSGLSLIHI